ncbi:MAG: hypothetical protein L3J33_03340 [Rhodobacteraceae bacterium]|nr:hypothetical protein [Paracoccaceae bacterium]
MTDLHHNQDQPRDWHEEMQRAEAEMLRIQRLGKLRWRILILAFVVAIIVVTFAKPTKADPEFYTSISIASLHVNATRDFNEFNPGIGIGVTWGNDVLRYGLEVGTFRNSYYFQSTYATANWRWRVATLGDVNIWAGGWLGFAEYPNLIGYADKFGIPRIGDFVMVGGASATVEFDRFNIVGLYTPVGNKMDGVLALKINIPFRQ